MYLAINEERVFELRDLYTMSHTMAGKTMDPQIHVLIPGNYITLGGKRDFAEIKKILSYPG